MSSIDPAEVSAYLDGELPAARAEEVRAAMAEDPALRAIFDNLATLDRDWRAAALSSAFSPATTIPARAQRTRSAVAVAAALALLVVVRLAPALGQPVAWHLALHVGVLAAVLSALFSSARSPQPA